MKVSPGYKNRPCLRCHRADPDTCPKYATCPNYIAWINACWDSFRGKQNEHQTTGFGVVLSSAIRYALGRQTYVVGVICEYVRPLLREIDENALQVIERDVREAIAAGETGDPHIDKPIWEQFLRDVHAAMEIRDIARWK